MVERDASEEVVVVCYYSYRDREAVEEARRARQEMEARRRREEQVRREGTKKPAPEKERELVRA
jgi:hypothetical protein